MTGAISKPPNTAMLFTVVTDRSLRAASSRADLAAPENAGGGVEAFLVFWFPSLSGKRR